MLLEKPERERGLKKERIIRVLLNHPEEDITKYRVAKLADVSEPWCREYTERLQEKDLLKDTKVIKPNGLYREWKNIRISPNQLTVALQKPMQLLENIELGYALTTYQAENLKQGLLFPSTTDFYVKEEEIEDWIQLIKERGSLGGGNTRLRATDQHVFYKQEEIEGYNIVSTPQLILDLLEEEGPCKEAARKLIDKFHGEEHG
ncbi:MAG: hypothetical protein BTN85_0995 [Candidatus Methanohalarchaeum thermophilum]|uniref:Uncharacterized protein n=1 Tax=Methanohalarchaeum thermophilum TaxID=1903181 RepID=A0A1Q6DVW7_METT1|nr:MAG: hypothetical protein BTN85_0995 [Candidatus Methanohalarchaeum thermophilum]